MRPDQLRGGFTTLLAERGLTLATLTLTEGVDAMLAFYRTTRVDGRPIDEDGDMLLFEWTQYPHADHQQVGLVRQAMRAGDDVVIWQLHLVFEFDAAPADLDNANRWCMTPDGVDAFDAFIRKSAAYRFGVDRPARVSLKRIIAN
ncbi:MAG: hypothetical protein ACI9U2_001016 [Bradymonadia bacterium]|jgi:hypothetical protein